MLSMWTEGISDRDYYAQFDCREPELDYEDGGDMECGVWRGVCKRHFRFHDRIDVGECCVEDLMTLSGLEEGENRLASRRHSAGRETAASQERGAA